MSVAPVGVKRIAFGKKKLLKNQGNGGFANSAVDTPVALPDINDVDLTPSNGAGRNHRANFAQALVAMGNGLIPQVIEAHNILLTIFWILAYLALSAVFAFQMYTLTSQYLSYKVDTSIKIVRKNEAQFPSVTVCNTNPVRKSIISKVARYEDLGSLDEYAESTLYSSASVDLGVTYTVTCSDGFIQCPTKECIPPSWMCDDIIDCSDSWDEVQSNCDAQQTGNENAYEAYNPDSYCVLGFIRCSATEPICASPCNNVTECSDGRDESEDIGCTTYTTCGGSLTATSSPQTFSSPNYASPYNVNDDCYWTITAQAGEVVKIEITDSPFSIESVDGSCPYDYLRFYKGESVDDSSKILINGKSKLCGFSAPTSPIYSSSQTMTAHFYSDYTGQMEGFQATYTSVSSAAARAKRDTSAFGSEQQEVSAANHIDASNDETEVKNRRRKALKEKSLRRHRRTAPWSDSGSWDTPGTSGYYSGPDGYPTYPANPTPYSFFNEYGDVNYDSSLWENYDAFYDYFDPYKSIPDTLQEYDWLALYDQSTSPDYSDLRAFALFSEDEIFWFGSQGLDFIAQCTYDGRDCDIASFIQFENPKFGNCFMFNSVYNQTEDEDGSFLKLRSTSKTGQEYGLKLTLFLDTENYIGVLSQKAGAQILINPAVDPVLPESDSTLLSAGTSTSLSIRQEVIKRRSKPYGDCFEDWPKNDLEFAEEFLWYWPVYNQKACEQYCIQRYMFQVCKCVQTYFPRFRTDNNASIYGNTLCSMWDPTQRSCTVQISKDYRNGLIKCPCNEACNDEYYTYSQSSSEWPNEKYAPYLISNIRKSTQSDTIRKYLNDLLSDYSLSTSQKTDHLRRNFLRVEVSYQNLNFEEVSEKPSYLITNLVTDFGGNIGLWIGWSVLSMLEILVLFFNFAKIICTGRI